MNVKHKQLAIISIVCFQVACGCSSYISCDHELCTEEEWLEHARIYAEDFCMEFFDDTNGIYELAIKDDHIYYFGDKNVPHLHSELQIVMDLSGRLLELSKGNLVLYPKDILNKDLQREICNEKR